MPLTQPDPEADFTSSDSMLALEELFIDIDEELARATDQYQPIRSTHEALSIIEEEVYEFRLEVYKKQKVHDPVAMRKELIQVAAMCVRTIIDLDL